MLVSNNLEQREVKMPEIKDNEVLIKVCAVGVNRGDITDVATTDGVCPGLECSGIIEAVGRNVNCWKVGEMVCAILEGGGYAEQVAVPANFLLPLPDDIDLDDAAGLPYASCCSLLALFKLHGPNTIETKKILIREGTSGIGALAIQYAKYLGLKVIASTGSSDNFSICHHYGADFCVDHTSTNFARAVIEKSGCVGVDLVLDYGASDLQRNVDCCCISGKVVIVDLHGMESGSVDLAILQEKQVEIKVFNLQSKNFGYKASVITELRTHLWPAVLQQKVVPAIEHRFPVIESQKALNLLRKDDSAGKSIVRMNFGETSGHRKMY
ncbi:uncharacterized protein [Henckelia pumila]|uniref:uncharacterized protein n=1 Tax=Henckelia pumila TaxID=405737 RepID=UPI003C6E58A0